MVTPVPMLKAPRSSQKATAEQAFAEVPGWNQGSCQEGLREHGPQGRAQGYGAGEDGRAAVGEPGATTLILGVRPPGPGQTIPVAEAPPRPAARADEGHLESSAFHLLSPEHQPHLAGEDGGGAAPRVLQGEAMSPGVGGCRAT